jgi:hypothetical protein
MIKLQLQLANIYEENGYSAALNFWNEMHDEINRLSENEQKALKKMMQRYCLISNDEKGASIISEKENVTNPQKRKIIDMLFRFGQAYQKGETLEKNESEANELFSIVMELGNSDELYRLGTMYKLGNGASKNLAKAAECFHKSASGGNRLAQFKLGEMYAVGLGVEKNRTEAEKWYASSSAEKNPYSSSLTKMVVPDGITVIDESAFEGFENLRSVKIPASVIGIGSFAFKSCRNLSEVNISKSTQLGKDCFDGCCLDEESLKLIKDIPYVFVKGNGGRIKDFLIGKYQITQELYEDIMGENPSYYKGSTLPVESMTVYDAIDFCNKLSERDGLVPFYVMKTHNNKLIKFKPGANGWRLPTLSEWRFVSRGGLENNVGKINVNNKLSEVAWYRDNSDGRTHPVGEKKPNSLGLYDMFGNVWELVLDGELNLWCMGGGWNTCEGSFEIDIWDTCQAKMGDSIIGFRIVRSCFPD